MPGASGREEEFSFKNKLVSLDSTTIDLCLSIYDWAHFRRTKGAIKLHLVLDHDGYLPSFAVITEGKVSDEIILLNGVKAEEKGSYPLRRVEVYDAKKEQTPVFLTNHFFKAFPDAFLLTRVGSTFVLTYEVRRHIRRNIAR